jgi:hypothetical protein
VAGNPFELDKVGLVKCAADAERPDVAGRATTEKGTIRIWSDGSYHCLLPIRPMIGHCISRSWLAAQGRAET